MISEEILEILEFIKEIEYRIDENENNIKIIVWIPFYSIDEFVKLFSPSMFDEGGIKVNLQENCIALDIKYMLDCSFNDNEVEYFIKKLKE